MTIIFDVINAFCILTGIVWIWRSWQLLKTLRRAPVIIPNAEAPKPSEKVSILVPAKNEENNIEACILKLLNQDYSNLEIIVINDNSTDRTGEILSQLAAHARPGVLKVIKASPTPLGWTGKNFALHCGIKHASGEWLLFTDADTRHEITSVRTALQHALAERLSLLTLLPRCLTDGFWEDILQPCAMSYMGLWFPIDQINDPKSKVYFGNGQYLMMKKDLYEKIGGHENVKGEYLEDFAMAKKAKQLGENTECALGDALYGTRMYDSLDAIWRGWRRIYLYAFEQKGLRIEAKALSVFLFSVMPFVFIFFSFWFALPVVVFILGIAWRAHAVTNAKKGYAFFHPLAALVFSAILMDAAGMAFRGEQSKWR